LPRTSKAAFPPKIIAGLLSADIRDSSGFRVIHTSDLRSQESGVLFIAHQVSGVTHVIPPRTASFMTYAECGSTCLSSVSCLNSFMQYRVLFGRYSVMHWSPFCGPSSIIWTIVKKF